MGCQRKVVGPSASATCRDPAKVAALARGRWGRGRNMRESFECSRPEIGRERAEGFSSRHCQVDDEKCALPPHEGRAPQPCAPTLSERPPTIPRGELRECTIILP